MLPAELEQILKKKNIRLDDFDIQYVVPQIYYLNGKEVVEEFELKFIRKDEE